MFNDQNCTGFEIDSSRVFINRYETEYDDN